jgi:hypothetical protein
MSRASRARRRRAAEAELAAALRGALDAAAAAAHEPHLDAQEAADPQGEAGGELDDSPDCCPELERLEAALAAAPEDTRAPTDLVAELLRALARDGGPGDYMRLGALRSCLTSRALGAQLMTTQACATAAVAAARRLATPEAVASFDTALLPLAAVVSRPGGKELL